MNDFSKFFNKTFTCIQCGECCGAWNLPIDHQLTQQLNESEFIQKILNDKQTSFKEINNQLYLPKENGICIFQDQKTSLCSIHDKLGENLKPIECQRFPFAFAKDLNGNICYDTSFYCKAILRNNGENLNENIINNAISKFDTFELPQKALFKPNQKINYNEINIIRKDICQYILKNCMDKEINNWPPILFYAYKTLLEYSSSNKLKNKEKITFSIHSNKNFENKIKLITSILLRKYRTTPDFFLLLLEKHSIKEPIICEKINLNNFNKINYSENDIIKEYLLRYLTDIIQRDILLAHKHSFAGIYMAMISAYCLCSWYQKALASLDNNIIEPFHTELAIRITERYYIGHNTKFMELFRDKTKYNILNLIFNY